MMMAMLAGVVTSLIIKELTPIATVTVMLALRFLFSVPPLALVAIAARGSALLAIKRKDRLIMRIAVGQVGIICWFLAIAHTTLGQATALFQSSAIFVTILSPLILKEKVGIYRGSAVFIGLFGIYLITNPSFDNINIGSLYGLGSAIAGAFLVVLLRLLGRTEEPVSVALWHNIVGAIIYPLAVLILIEANIFADTIINFWLLVIILGVASSMVQIGFTTAYRYGEAIMLAPIRYLSVPIAVVLGWFIWDESVSLTEVLGMLIVVFSCVFISLREYFIDQREHHAPPA